MAPKTIDAYSRAVRRINEHFDCCPDQLKLEQRERFWDAFKACLEENRVRSDRSDFDVKWAQAFGDFRAGKKLMDRSADDIRSFLEHLRDRPRIEEWQVQQG